MVEVGEKASMQTENAASENARDLVAPFGWRDGFGFVVVKAQRHRGLRAGAWNLRPPRSVKLFVIGRRC